MILAVDVGNTTIGLAVVKGERLKKTWMVKTALNDKILRDEFKRTLGRLKKFTFSIEAVVICSVVPQALTIISPILEKIFQQKPLVIGRDIKVPIKNLYRQPSQVGQDRLVCAYAAMMLYGAPAIVVDFGTAITFDVVSKKKEYLGGVIIPGLRLYAESLFEKTALLPKVEIQPPRELIGRDTKNSILSGVFYGYSALCNGVIRLITKQTKKKPIVVITGGYSGLIKRFIKSFDAIDKFLVFKGIALIYQTSLLSRNNHTRTSP